MTTPTSVNAPQAQFGVANALRASKHRDALGRRMAHTDYVRDALAALA